MKERAGLGLVMVAVVGGWLAAGCSTNVTEGAVEGAAMGAVSASFVGALTDLVVDGRVNTYRLERNMVGGAIAGGTAGAIAGSGQDRAEARQKEAEERAAAKERARTEREASAAKSEEALRKEIGSDNYQALVDLLNFKHEDAYRRAIAAANSDNESYQLSSLVVQALIDHDRQNEAGVEASLKEFVSRDKEIQDLETAKRELGVLYQELLDERKVRGIRR